MNTIALSVVITQAYMGSALHAPVMSNRKPSRIGVTVWADMLAV